MPPDFVTLTGTPDFEVRDQAGAWVPGPWARGLKPDQVASVLERREVEVFTVGEDGAEVPLRFARGPSAWLERAGAWLEGLGLEGGRSWAVRLLLVLAVLLILWAMAGKR